MNELIATFHIDWKLIIAQLINFGIILFVLQKFAYKPMMKMMNERSEKIENGLKNAEESRKKLTEITEKEKEVLIEARKQAQEIIKKAEEAAGKDASVIVAEAKSQTEKMLSQAKIQIEEEKEKILKDVRNEIAGLVMAATEKVIVEKLNSDKDKEIIERAVSDLK